MIRTFIEFILFFTTIVRSFNAGNLPRRLRTTSLGSLYRPLADNILEELLSTANCQLLDIDAPFRSNTAPAKGLPEGSVVDMKTWALQGPEVEYARIALLSTSTPDSNDMISHIQVLNAVVFPKRKDLPVWGADFVRLPGNKDLLLLDAQPMNEENPYEDEFQTWHSTVTDVFPWGGDLPLPVQKFVSKYALWSRFTSEGVDITARLQTDLYEATLKHLHTFLDIISRSKDNERLTSWCSEYIQYRRDNDPARPMLTRLYGEEWTEELLRKVLFPQTSSPLS